MEIGEKNRKVVGDRVRAEASRDPELAKLPKDERSAQIEQRAADTSARMDYSLGRRNAGQGDASPRAVNDFMDSEKWRRGVERGRLTLGQQLKDYTGTKRHDSDDSFSYRPVFKVGGTAYTENGNSVDIAEAAGGKFNIFSPNSPVDADMRRYLDKLPTREEYEKRSK